MTFNIPAITRQLYTLVSFFYLALSYYGNPFFILPVRPVQDTGALSSPFLTLLLQPLSHSSILRTSSVGTMCVFKQSSSLLSYRIASQFLDL